MSSIDAISLNISNKPSTSTFKVYDKILPLFMKIKETIIYIFSLIFGKSDSKKMTQEVGIISSFKQIAAKCLKEITEVESLKNSHDPLLRLFSGGNDDKGRSLQDIFQKDLSTLEHEHDYIQRIFPLLEKSNADPQAPLSSSEVRKAFEDHPQLKENLKLCFHFMLRFYGLTYQNRKVIGVGSKDYVERRKVWIESASGHHNFLRISRMIKSLKYHGLKEEGDAFKLFILDLPNQDPIAKRNIPDVSLEAWKMT